MALKLRLARGGRKDRPHYSIVVADSRNARDGRFIEKVGTYDPLMKKGDERRVRLVEDRIKHWLANGARPTDRVARFLGQAGLAEMPAQGNNPQKAKPKAKAQEREKERQEKLEAAKAAEEEAKAASEAEAAEAATQEATGSDAPEAVVAATEELNDESADQTPSAEAEAAAAAEGAASEEAAGEATPSAEEEAEQEKKE